MYTSGAAHRCVSLRSKPVLTMLLCLVVALLPVLELPAVPYVIGVPALGPGREVLSRWAPVVDSVSGLTGHSIRLVIESEQQELMSGLRGRRLDAVLLDPISVYRLGSDVPLQVLATVALGTRAELNGESRPQYVLIVPSRSRTFAPVHTMGQAVSVPDLYNHPSVAVFTAMVFQDAGLPIPRFEYTDTQESILKGVSYGQLQVGVVSRSLLSDPAMTDFVSNVRPIALTRETPPWALVGRIDGQNEAHDQIAAVLVGELSTQYSNRGVRFFAPKAMYNLDGVMLENSESDSALLERALRMLRVLEVNAHVPSE